MENMKKLIVDLSKPKGMQEEWVDLTSAELEERAQAEQDVENKKIAEEQAQAEKAAARKSAEEKLAALGLTPEEISAMLG